MVVVLGFDNGDGDIGLVIEDVVGALGFAAGDEPAPDDDPALGEADFLADLGELVPAGLLQGRGDELGADVALAEGFLVHGADLGCRGVAPDRVLCARTKQLGVDAIGLV